MSSRHEGGVGIKEGEGLAPAHSFWALLGKLTICPRRGEVAGRAEAMAPPTPLKPSWMRALEQPARSIDGMSRSRGCGSRAAAVRRRDLGRMERARASSWRHLPAEFRISPRRYPWFALA